MARLIGHFEPGSPEWHAARAAGLGGSEVAAAAGLSPFESPFGLHHRKAGLIGPVEETTEMEWGRRLEPVILGKFADEHPDLTLTRPAGTWCHDERPWQIGNPDGLVDDGIVEAKFSVFGDGWGKSGTADVPIHVRIQVLWYLDTLDLHVGYVALLVGGFDWREYRIEAAPAEVAQLRDIGRRFLDGVAAGHRPDIDEHGATYQAVRELHPDIELDEVMLPNDIARGFIAARARLKAATAKEQRARSLVADAMGNAKKAVWDGSTIATRQARGDGVPYIVAAKGVDGLLGDVAEPTLPPAESKVVDLMEALQQSVAQAKAARAARMHSPEGSPS